MTTKYKSYAFLLSGILAGCFIGNIINQYPAIYQNWNKVRDREVVECWYENEGYSYKTLISASGAAGIPFYIKRDNRYKEEYSDSLYFLDNYNRDWSAEEKISYIEFKFNEELPEVFFLCSSYGFLDTYKDISEILQKNNYTSNELYVDSEGIIVQFTKE